MISQRALTFPFWSILVEFPQTFGAHLREFEGVLTFSGTLPRIRFLSFVVTYHLTSELGKHISLSASTEYEYRLPKPKPPPSTLQVSENTDT